MFQRHKLFANITYTRAGSLRRDCMPGSTGYSMFVGVEKSFLNLVKSNQIWIVITFILTIWHQTEFHLMHKSIIGKCRIQSKFGAT